MRVTKLTNRAMKNQKRRKIKEIRPKPWDYTQAEITQALADLVEMGLVVDSGERKFQNGKWQIVWVAAEPGAGAPTPDQIDAVIFDMIAAEAAGVPDRTSLDDLWSSMAFDPTGEWQGYGFGHTPTDARAGAWITAWWPECDLRAVPHTVPEGWTFEIFAPGEGPVFRRT